MAISFKFGAEIKKLRKDKGLSLRALGKRAGISFSYISEIERGNYTPSLEVVEYLCTALDVKVWQFIKAIEDN